MNPSLRIDEPGDARRHERWIVPTIGLLSVLSMLPGWSSLAHYWLDVADYNYGVLIAAVAVVWLWYSRGPVVAIGITPELRLLPALALLLLGWYSLWQGHSELGSQLLMPVVTWLSLAVVVGRRAALPLLMPVGYLYFAMPIWDELLPYLQQLSIFGASRLLRLAGVAVTVNGSLLEIAEGTFDVLYACSGLRYLLVSLALAFLAAALERMTLVRALVFLAVTAPLAMVANWIRIAIVVYAGHVTGMSHYFVSDNHKGLGNIVFGVLLLLIYLIARRIQPHTKPASESQSLTSLAVDRRRLVVAASLVAVLLAVFTAMSARAAYSADATSLPPRLLAAPVAAGEWQGPLPATAAWMPIYACAADTRRLSYQRAAANGAALLAGRHVEVYLNVYGKQQQGAELIYFQNTLQAPGVWHNAGKLYPFNVLLSALGREPHITEYLSRDGERWIFGRMYVIGGTKTASAIIAQLLYGASTMTRAAPAGLIAIAVRCQEDCTEAGFVIKGFWKDMGAALSSTLPTTINEVDAMAALAD